MKCIRDVMKIDQASSLGSIYVLLSFKKTLRACVSGSIRHCKWFFVNRPYEKSRSASMLLGLKQPDIDWMKSKSSSGSLRFTNSWNEGIIVPSYVWPLPWSATNLGHDLYIWSFYDVFGFWVLGAITVFGFVQNPSNWGETQITGYLYLGSLPVANFSSSI